MRVPLAIENIGLVTVSYHSETAVRALVEDLIVRGRTVFPCVVVSNSGDGEGLRNIPGVTVVQPGRNLGFGRACNLGVSHLDTAYVLFCNPDVRLGAQTAEVLANLLEANPEYAVVAPFESHDRTVFAPTGRIADVPISNFGGVFMMRRDQFREVGGFDENLFLWFEDTDLRDRILSRGWRIGRADGVVVPHYGGHSMASADRAQRLFLTRAWLCSHAYYLIKHKGLLAAWLWCLGMSAKNLLLGLLGRPHHRQYVLRLPASAFGVWLASNPMGMLERVVFDGDQYGWQV